MKSVYEIRRDWYRFLTDSYHGGYNWLHPTAHGASTQKMHWRIENSEGETITQTGQYASYLVPHPGESTEQFETRHKLSTYLNIVSPIVKAYSEGVTSDVKRDLGSIVDMATDVDRQGTSWGDLAASVAAWACVHGVVATVVDSPQINVAGMSEQQRRLNRIQPYVVVVHPTNWLCARLKDGRLVEFAYLVPSEANDKLFAMRWLADKGWSLHDTNDCNFTSGNTIASGPLPPVLEGEIPVTLAYYERDTSVSEPLGLPLIQDAATSGRLVNNMISWVAEIDRNASFPFLAVPSPSTAGVLDRTVKLQVGPSRALGVDSNSGSPVWVEPSGNSQRSLREQCVFLFNWTYRSVGMEVVADSGSGVQSGEALRIRSRDFESRALQFAKRMQAWEMATLKLFAKIGGVSFDEIRVQYSNRVTLKIPTEELQRALSLLSAPSEIGPIARKEAVVQAVSAALTLSQEQLTEISQELGLIYEGDLEAERSIQGAAKAEADSKALELSAPKDAPVSNETIAGAQMTALIEIAKSIGRGEIPLEYGKQLVKSTYSTLINPTVVDAMFASLVGFKPPVSSEEASVDSQGKASSPVVEESEQASE